MSCVSFVGLLLLVLLHLNLRMVQAVKCDAESKGDQEVYKQCILRAFSPDVQEVTNACWDQIYEQACGGAEGECCLCPTSFCQLLLCLYEKLDEATAKGISERAELCYTERYVKDDSQTQDCLSKKIMEMSRGPEITEALQECFFDDVGGMTNEDTKVKCSSAIKFWSCASEHGVQKEEIEEVGKSFIDCSKEHRKDPPDFIQV